ncbi:MFS transporter [Paucibacter sp. DJ1R-11]|nr:MFS transporter [Paucibacter sp. DJ1R-11]
MQDDGTMLADRSVPALRRLLLGEWLGLLASSASQTSLSWWMASHGGAADLAIYGSAMALCSVLAMPLLSPLGDRLCKARVVCGARLGLVLEALLLAGLAHFGHYAFHWICLCGLASCLANAALLPAQASLLPELVPAAQLPQAIRLRRRAQALGSLLGPALAGAALGLRGSSASLLLSCGLAVAAAAAAWRMSASATPCRALPPRSRRPWSAELRAGLRAKWGIELDRWWTLCGALMMVFFQPATGMLLPLRLQALGLSAGWFGACGAALSAGLLIGLAGLADALILRLDRVRAIALAVALCGLALGGLGLCEQAPGLLLLFALIGICMSVTQLVGQTHRALAVPDAFRSRMAAAQLGTAQLAASLAPALAGFLLLLLDASLPAIYLIMAGGFLCNGLGLLLIPELRGFLRLDHEQVRDWYVRRYPMAFKGE